MYLSCVYAGLGASRSKGPAWCLAIYDQDPESKLDSSASSDKGRERFDVCKYVCVCGWVGVCGVRKGRRDLWGEGGCTNRREQLFRACCRRRDKSSSCGTTSRRSTHGMSPLFLHSTHTWGLYPIRTYIDKNQNYGLIGCY